MKELSEVRPLKDYPEINFLNDELKAQRKINSLFKISIQKALRKKRSKDFLFSNDAFLYKKRKRYYLFEADILPKGMQ